VNAEPAGSLGDVAVAIDEHSIDVLPLHASERRYGLGRLGELPLRGQASLESHDHLIDSRRLRQVVRSA
jgi:hypothetical protein